MAIEQRCSGGGSSGDCGSIHVDRKGENFL